MKLGEYLEDHAIYFLCCILVVLVQSLLLVFLGNTISMVVLLDFIWIAFFGICFLLDYFHKLKRFQRMDKIKQSLDKKYLLHEVLPKGGTFEEKYYKNLLYIGNKAMLEEVSNKNRERQEYQEYIEQWVHEIKTPIAAMKLWSENQKVERRRDLMQQIERIEHYVEQTLYFARSENVNKDFHIHKVNLSSCIQESLLENKYLCMNSGIRVEVPHIDYFVYSDEKWVIFILNQLIENAVKYRCEKDPCIIIEIEEQEGKSSISIKDNGQGIDAQDFPRIFEKGFTGKNGRNINQHATGIGLYLCKHLCVALAIEIEAIPQTVGTCITLGFKPYRTVRAQ